MANTPFSFDLSECSRVKDLLYNADNPLHKISIDIEMLSSGLHPTTPTPLPSCKKSVKYFQATVLDNKLSRWPDPYLTILVAKSLISVQIFCINAFGRLELGKR